MKTVRLALLLALAAAPLALAQPPKGYYAWWDNPVVVRDLNLTEQQTHKIRETVREFRGRLIDLRAAVNKADADLEDFVSEDQVDPRRVNEAIERLATSRGDLTRALAQMTLRMRQVLTQQQWHMLQERRRRNQPLVQQK